MNCPDCGTSMLRSDDEPDDEVWYSCPSCYPDVRNVAMGRLAEHAGLRAVSDLRRWLTLTTADVARIAWLSESTIYWWAQHPSSKLRPAKVERLLALHALAGGLVEEFGEDGARRWFRLGNPSPLDQLRHDPTGLATVEETGYRLLLDRAQARLAEASR